MAFRIDSYISHGEVDNTLHGCTTGKLWLVGQKKPLRLLLEGDCWRDIAGSLLTFKNLKPEAPTRAVLKDLDLEQNGIVGDITASRKVRVPTVEESEWEHYLSRNEPLPTAWTNSLYLEWFSEANGRVVVESADYEITLSQHEWDMDEDEEAAQKLANMQGMRDFMNRVIQPRTESEIDQREDADEFEWEERLKESDRLAEAYSEVMEKYLDAEDAEQKEAFVMGWDNLLAEMADEDEGLDSDDDDEDNAPEWIDDAVEIDFNFEENSEDDEISVECTHPIQQTSRDLTIEMMDWSGDIGEFESRERLVTAMIKISSRLGSVFDIDEPDARNNGFLLAIFKRCINWSHDAIRACSDLHKNLSTPKQKKTLEDFQLRIFQLRDDLTDLRRQYRKN